jgi:transcriptional antiterminator RfaH
VPRFLFPRYIFIRIAEVWQSVLNVIGFVTLVKAENDVPAKISDRVIDALKARENPFGLIELNAGGWRHGQRLRITEGPFRGEVALHLEVDAQQNEIALLNLLGRRVRVQLDARSVEAA